MLIQCIKYIFYFLILNSCIYYLPNAYIEQKLRWQTDIDSISTPISADIDMPIFMIRTNVQIRYRKDDLDTISYQYVSILKLYRCNIQGRGDMTVTFSDIIIHNVCTFNCTYTKLTHNNRTPTVY